MTHLTTKVRYINAALDTSLEEVIMRKQGLFDEHDPFAFVWESSYDDDLFKKHPVRKHRNRRRFPRPTKKRVIVPIYSKGPVVRRTGLLITAHF